MYSCQSRSPQKWCAWFFFRISILQVDLIIFKGALQRRALWVQDSGMEWFSEPSLETRGLIVGLYWCTYIWKLEQTSKLPENWYHYIFWRYFASDISLV
jgi:hypothetical protein